MTLLRDSIGLTEDLPFLVCMDGFDKQLRLAKAIFNHPPYHPCQGGLLEKSDEAGWGGCL
jgi:hypothetical protein